MPENIICPNCKAQISKETKKIEKPNILIVEGKEDELFFNALILKFNIQNMQIMPIGGKDNIKYYLNALILQDNFESVTALGIVRDSDSRPRDAFRSIQNSLKSVRLSVPDKVGTFTQNHPRIGIMLIPSIDRKGALENLCLESVADDPAYSCVEQYFDCLQQQGFHSLREIAKAKVRVFLSSREDPTLPLGIGAQKNYWPLEHSVFTPIISFLKELSV